MARPKRTDPHLRVAHSIEEQLMIRQFNARQHSILKLILRLSWGCGKEYAHIPVLRDFEVAGVHRSDITAELQRLVRQRVIFHDTGLGQFAFNKDFEQWAVSLAMPAVLREGRLQELIASNLPWNCPPVGDLLTRLLVICQQPVGDSPTPSATPAASGKKAPERKGKKDTTTPPGVEISKNYGEVCRLYESNIGMLSPIVAQELDLLATEYPLEWITEAFKEAVRMEKRALKYIQAILTRWSREGFKSQHGRKTGLPPGRPPRTQLPTGKELNDAWRN